MPVGGFGNSPATSTPASGGGGTLYPNQPGGYTKLLETNDALRPKAGSTAVLSNVTTGNSAFSDYSPTGLVTVVSTGSVPEAGYGAIPAFPHQTTVLQHNIETGTPVGEAEAGSDVAEFWLWQNQADPGGNGGYGADEFSEIYMSHTFCMLGNGTNFEGHIKFSYFGVANNNQSAALDAGPTQLFIIFEDVNGTGGPPSTATEYTISLNNQAKPGQVQYDQNMNLTTYVRVNHVHQMENQFILSSAGGSDGTWNCWLDGVQVAHFTNVQFISSGFAGNGGNGLSGFCGWQWTPWWQGGGGSTAKTRDDYVILGHSYVSGIFLRNRT